MASCPLVSGLVWLSFSVTFFRTLQEPQTHLHNQHKVCGILTAYLPPPAIVQPPVSISQIDAMNQIFCKDIHQMSGIKVYPGVSARSSQPNLSVSQCICICSCGFFAADLLAVLQSYKSIPRWYKTRPREKKTETEVPGGHTERTTMRACLRPLSQKAFDGTLSAGPVNRARMKNNFVSPERLKCSTYIVWMVLFVLRAHGLRKLWNFAEDYPRSLCVCSPSIARSHLFVLYKV